MFRRGKTFLNIFMCLCDCWSEMCLKHDKMFNFGLSGFVFFPFVCLIGFFFFSGRSGHLRACMHFTALYVFACVHTSESESWRNKEPLSACVCFLPQYIQCMSSNLICGYFMGSTSRLSTFEQLYFMLYLDRGGNYFDYQLICHLLLWSIYFSSDKTKKR